MKGLFARFTGAEDERPAVKAARLRAELAQLELSVLQDGSPETETAAVVHDDQPQTPLPPRRDVLGPLRRLHGNRLPARPEAQRIAETSSVIAPSSRSEDTNGDDDLLVNDESVKEQNAPPSGWMGRVVQAMTSTVRVDDDVAEFKSESERLAGPRGSSAEERHSREMDDDPAYNALMAAHQVVFPDTCPTRAERGCRSN